MYIVQTFYNIKIDNVKNNLNINAFQTSQKRKLNVKICPIYICVVPPRFHVVAFSWNCHCPVVAEHHVAVEELLIVRDVFCHEAKIYHVACMAKRPKMNSKARNIKAFRLEITQRNWFGPQGEGRKLSTNRKPPF